MQQAGADTSNLKIYSSAILAARVLTRPAEEADLGTTRECMTADEVSDVGLTPVTDR
ncbi:MAG: hypothetical protein AB7F94_10620 [Nitrospira sp.]